MMEAAKGVAERAAAKPIAAAVELANATISKHIARLEDLATRNPQVSSKEIVTLKATLKETSETLGQARVRLDALRLIMCS